MKKQKDLTRILFYSISIGLIILIAVCGILIKVYFDNYGSNGGVKTKHTTDMYAVASNPNDYQIDIYEELALACEKITDFESDGSLIEIAPLVTKSFVADYFTWSNKRGSYDVGGLDYVFGPSHLNISKQSRYYYYSDLDLLIKQYGSKNLPTVKDIEITECTHLDDPYAFSITLFDYEKNENVTTTTDYDAYHVAAKWQYEESETYDVSKLPTKGNFLLVRRANRLEIAYYHEDFY